MAFRSTQVKTKNTQPFAYEISFHISEVIRLIHAFQTVAYVLRVD